MSRPRLNARPLRAPQDACDAAEKVASDLREELEGVRKEAAEATARAMDLHAIELQRLEVERSKLEVRGGCGRRVPRLERACRGRKAARGLAARRHAFFYPTLHYAPPRPQAAHEEAMAALRLEMQELASAAEAAHGAVAAKEDEAAEVVARVGELEAELEETKAALGAALGAWGGCGAACGAWARRGGMSMPDAPQCGLRPSHRTTGWAVRPLPLPFAGEAQACATAARENIDALEAAAEATAAEHAAALAAAADALARAQADGSAAFEEERRARVDEVGELARRLEEAQVGRGGG